MFTRVNIDILADGSSQKPNKTYAHYAEVQASKKISSFHLASSSSASSAEVFFAFVLQVVKSCRSPEPHKKSLFMPSFLYHVQLLFGAPHSSRCMGEKK